MSANPAQQGTGPGKKGMPGWAIALVVVAILVVLGAILIPVTCLVVMGGATGGAMYMQQKKLDKQEAAMQREAERALSEELEMAEERDEQMNKILMELKDMKDESEMTEEELARKKELEDLLESLSADGK